MGGGNQVTLPTRSLIMQPPDAEPNYTAAQSEGRLEAVSTSATLPLWGLKCKAAYETSESSLMAV